MIRGGTLNSRARRARRSAPAAARALAAAAAATAGALAVSLAAATMPALAAQHPGGMAASHARASATGQHMATGRTSPGAPWAHIAAGADHTCGIRTDGTLWCWGQNSFGDLGIGNVTNQDRPWQVTTPAPGGWASVTAGFYHTCATRTDGTLWCWGWNELGQLGIGGSGYYSEEDLPQQVTTPAPGGWASVTAGFYHTCATRTGGTLWCWGDNGNGQLGAGFYGTSRPEQVTTPAAEGWASAAAGAVHTCATRAGGTLWCWGENDSGQIGIGNLTNQDRPRQVTTPAPGGWASVTAGFDATCATRAGSTLWCWGWNDAGQLGIGNRTDQDRPQQVTTPAPGGWSGITSGGQHTCATHTGGTLWCWGAYGFGALGIGGHTGADQPRQVTIPAPAGWASVTAGGSFDEDHTCATRGGGSLWCWGENFYGQLGIGCHTDQNRPHQVTSTMPGTQAPPARTSTTVTRLPMPAGGDPWLSAQFRSLWQGTRGSVQ